MFFVDSSEMSISATSIELLSQCLSRVTYASEMSLLLGMDQGSVCVMPHGVE